MNPEIKIEPISEREAEDHPKLCEIRFDCLVTMYDMACIGKNEAASFGLPQWFKSTGKITLEFVKDADERSIGAYIKDMFLRLESHIKNVEQL